MIVVRSRVGRVMEGRLVSSLLSSPMVMSPISSPMMLVMSGPDEDRDWDQDTHRTRTNIPHTQSRSVLLTEIKTLKISVDFRDKQFYREQLTDVW